MKNKLWALVVALAVVASDTPGLFAQSAPSTDATSTDYLICRNDDPYVGEELVPTAKALVEAKFNRQATVRFEDVAVTSLSECRWHLSGRVTVDGRPAQWSVFLVPLPAARIYGDEDLTVTMLNN